MTHAPPGPTGAAAVEDRPPGHEPGGTPSGGGEFAKLVARRRDVDLTAIALEIAADHDPACDPQAVRRWLADRADEARGRVVAAESGRAALAALADVLCGDHELCGGAAAFDDPAGSLLHRVVQTGTGLPIALSLVYLDVAARVGLDLRPVNAPHHFLTRLDDADDGPGGRGGPLFCDPYHAGQAMTEAEVVAFLAGRCGTGSILSDGLTREAIAASLAPCGPRAVVIRVLNNLKALHARSGDWAAAWAVQSRLSALCPADYTERRDLALIALHAGRAGRAVDLLTALLPDAPPDETPVLKRHLTRAVGQVSRWN